MTFPLIFPHTFCVGRSWKLHSASSFGKFLHSRERFPTCPKGRLRVVSHEKWRKMQNHPTPSAPSFTLSYTRKSSFSIDNFLHWCRMCRRKLRKKTSGREENRIILRQNMDKPRHFLPENAALHGGKCGTMLCSVRRNIR